MANRPKRRIDVMVSSTTKDLTEHRKQVSEAIQRLKWTPLAMEYDEAVAGKDALKYSLDLVDEAEIYVGIFGVRYGFEPPDAARNPEGVSITEAEYRRAKQRSIPILIFIAEESHPFPAALLSDETAKKRRKLKRLKDELQANHIVSFFTSAEDLRSKVLQSLVGVQQSGLLSEEKEDNETAAPPEANFPLPAPPTFYADPPYSLTSEFIGRTNELRQLDAWAASPDPLLIVEAIGGMGKSAVTWEWVQRQLRTGHEFEGVLWWSFYESGATMAAFVRHALAYITRTDPDSLKGVSLKENFTRLRLELGKGRYLLVLDGLERVLVAYHRWNAAQMRDDTVEEAESIIKDRDIRTCTDPKDDDVLRGLLACDRSKVLISSRLLPLALEDRTGTLSRGVAHVHLNGLHAEDALALTRAAGVTVRDVAQFTRFIESFGGHSLLVKLVAGRVLKFRRGRGDFDRWYAEEGRSLTVADFDLRQQQTHILEYALAGLDETARHFLSQIAAFGDAVPYDTLSVFNPFVQPASEPVKEPDNVYWERWRDEADTEEEKQRYQQRIDAANARYADYQQAQAEYEAYLKSPAYRSALTQFDQLLSDLEERGLLRWERDTDTYDMHPVVRGTTFEQLEGAGRTATFERIRGHFEALPPEDIDAAQTVADLTNTIAIYRALVGAGRWDDAVEFFQDRLQDKLHYNVAAYYTIIELLTPLFPDGTDRLPRLDDPSLQSSITTTLAAMFSYIGRVDEALTLEGLSLKLALDQDNSASLGVSLRNYASSLTNNNQLALAERTREAALALALATDNQNQITMSTLYLLGNYRDTGQWDKAEDAYAALGDNPPRKVYWQVDVERYYAETLVSRGLDASAALDKAETLVQQGRDALGLRQIKGLRGEVALQVGDYAAAIRSFEEYVQLSRQAGSSDVFVALGGLARAYALAGAHDRAQDIIEQGVGGIDAAEVYLTLGEQDKAREYAIRAYKYAWADGPPYIWWWKLERTKAVLDALVEPYPDMPPFDPDQVGKYPYQDEIEDYIERQRAAHKDEEG